MEDLTMQSHQYMALTLKKHKHYEESGASYYKENNRLIFHIQNN